MKYIRPFNENVDNLVEELQDLCDTSLAYLYDEGYNISLAVRDKVKYPGKNHIVVSLGLQEENFTPFRVGLRLQNDGYRNFYWHDVKDYYIPFLQLLVRRYELQPYLDDTAQVYLQFNTISGFRYLSLDAVINDRTGLDYPLWGINLKVLDRI
jgi:hypothetical protein